MLKNVWPILLLAASASATEVYMSKDKDGNVSFSSRPSQGAKKHVVRELPSMPAFTATQSKQATPNGAPAEVTTAAPYESLLLSAPTSGSHLVTQHAGNVSIKGTLTPKLKRGHTLVVSSSQSGRTVASAKNFPIRVSNLSRGEHTLTVAVQSATGDTLIQSQPITLYVQRHSILNTRK